MDTLISTLYIMFTHCDYNHLNRILGKKWGKMCQVMIRKKKKDTGKNWVALAVEYDCVKEIPTILGHIKPIFGNKNQSK